MNKNDEDYKTQIALLEKDVSQVTVFLGKLDSAIEKLCDVSASIKELLAVHDHKLTQQSEVNSEIYDMIKELKIENHKEHLETKSQLDQLAVRISSLEKWKYTIVGGAAVAGFILSYVTKAFT
jgi:flagellar motility protein MotE (MotC chaperone)